MLLLPFLDNANHLALDYTLCSQVTKMQQSNTSITFRNLTSEHIQLSQLRQLNKQQKREQKQSQGGASGAPIRTMIRPESNKNKADKV